MLNRTNKASARTRKARAALKGRVESVTVRSFDLMGGSEIRADELEPAMAARAVLVAVGFECERIERSYDDRFRFFFA